MQTDWMIYRDDECRQTIYVNARAESWEPECGHALRLVGVADEQQVEAILRAVRL